MNDITKSASNIRNLGILKNSQILKIISSNDVDNIKQWIHGEYQKHVPLLPKNLHKVMKTRIENSKKINRLMFISLVSLHLRN